MLTIDRLRDDLRAASGRWSAGANVFTTMPIGERRRHLGYRPAPDEPSLPRREAMSRMTRRHGDTVPPLRSAVDLRATRGCNFVSPAGERTVGSCSATMRTIIESTLRIERDNPLLAVGDPPLDNDRPLVGRAWLTESFAAVTVRARAGHDGDTLVVGIRRWYELHTRAAMKQWLATRGPLLAVLAVHEDFFAYASGVYHFVSGPLEGGHCVAVIGYDDGGAYWIAQNTWGTAWGERGTFRIAFGERGIDASMWGVELR